MKYLLSNKNFFRWKIKWYLDENPLSLSRGHGLIQTSSLEQKDQNYYGQIPVIISDKCSSEVKVLDLELKYLGSGCDFYPILIKDQYYKLDAYDLIIDHQKKNHNPLIMVNEDLIEDFIPKNSCQVL